MQEALNQKIDAFVAANKEQILKDIATLVSINSVEGAPEEGAPYGAGPRAALDKTLELAAGMGLATRNCENHIGYAELAGADAEKYLKIFTFLSREEIEELAKEHEANPGARPLQKRLAKELTVMVHSEKDYEAAVEASQILFSNSAGEALKALDERTLLDIFEGVPRFEVSKSEIEAGIPALDFLAVKTQVFPSKGEARKMIQGGGVSVNKEKLTDPTAVIDASALLGGKYIHVQKGKKNHFLIVAI